jgi:hypothetical protein
MHHQWLSPLQRPCLLLLLAFAANQLIPNEVNSAERLLPEGIEYDKAIPSPATFLGFNWGQRHLYHHELVSYCQMLAELSPRVQITKYATTYGGRPLLAVTISSPENLRRLKVIRKAHRQLANPDAPLPKSLDKLPLCMWMCYGVHGNEASATNVSIWVAYHLAAAKDNETQRWLNETIIRLDPSLNPDGFERFAHWTNNHRGRFPSSQPEDREHSEDWPSGRTNYYWFDLNRDWLPIRHPESRGRIHDYHQWKPNVVLDFHEMGSHSTYFFQPGIPARNNPLTPHRVFDLTGQIAEFHAKALDQRGALFYTQERFDDFYMGKGSTYPDLHGGIGILFEQASARGIKQETRHGKLTFRQALQNQFSTSLSSLRASVKLRQELLDWKREFYRGAIEEARRDKITGYVVTSPDDPARLIEFERLLRAHDIVVNAISRDLKLDGDIYGAAESLMVPTVQPEYRFVRSLFEKRTSFAENIFYDVSTWTLPLSFGLQYAEYRENVNDVMTTMKARPKPRPLDKPSVAYVIDWRGYRAPRLLNRLLAADVAVYATPAAITIRTDDKVAKFPAGSLIVPIKQQPTKRVVIRRLLVAASGSDHVRIRSAVSALTNEGPDLGSDRMVRLEQPHVLVIAGAGASTYEAGEVWYVADRQLEMTITLVPSSRLGSIDLDQYNRLVVVSGRHRFDQADCDKLKAWLKRGGTLIGYGGAVAALESAQILKNAIVTRNDSVPEESPLSERRPYGSAQEAIDLQLISGAILQTNVDQTHPLGFGLPAQLPVFRDHETLIAPSQNIYANPLVYAADSVMSGYVSDENRALLKQCASVVVHPHGTGRVIVLAENPNFRAFWLGTERLFYNAIFLPDMISNQLSD